MQSKEDLIDAVIKEANRLFEEKKAAGWTQRDFANALKQFYAVCPSSSFCRKHPLLRNKAKK